AVDAGGGVLAGGDLLPDALAPDRRARLGPEVGLDDGEHLLQRRALLGLERRAAVAVDAARAEARAEVAREGRVEDGVGDEDVVYRKHGSNVTARLRWCQSNSGRREAGRSAGGQERRRACSLHACMRARVRARVPRCHTLSPPPAYLRRKPPPPTMPEQPAPRGPLDAVRRDEDFEKALRPLALDEFVGQEKIKDNLRVFITAALQRGEALDHV